MAPLLVTVFSALAALIAAAAGATLLFPGTALDAIWAIRSDDVHMQMLALGPAVGAGLWLVALVALACAVGSAQHRRWAWWIAIVAMGINGVSDVGRLFAGGIVEGLVGVVIAGLIALWLTRPRVVAQFDR